MYCGGPMLIEQINNTKENEVCIESKVNVDWHLLMTVTFNEQNVNVL